MTELDWDRLQRLRDRFLKTDASHRNTPDYWLESADLEVYDQVLAERIGWKWDAVLAEVAMTGFVESEDPDVVPLAEARILDWGCGTGIAGRRFVEHFGGGQVTLHDRSAAAMEFAETRLRDSAPGLKVRTQPVDPDIPDVLLISHVLGELDEHSAARLLKMVRRCRRVLWVEAGTRVIARRLSAIRDLLLEDFDVLAPCPHRSTCSALRAGEQHWCHLFARPPAEVFMDGTWMEIGRRLKIDLRALPYHFLALMRANSKRPADDGPASARLIGRPSIRNKFVRFHECNEAGLTDRTVFKGREPDLYKRIKKTGAI